VEINSPLKIYLRFSTVIVKNKLEHFSQPLRCNEINFHDVRRLSYNVIKPLSKYIIYNCGVFIPVLMLQNL